MNGLRRFLQPHLHLTLRRSLIPEHARIYTAFKRRSARLARPTDAAEHTHDYEKRIKQLEGTGDLAALYPSNPRDTDRTTAHRIHEVFSRLKNDQIRTDVTVTVFGRVTARRSSGSKLFFLDLYDRGHTIQAVCNLGNLERYDIQTDNFRRVCKVARKGDIIAVTGHPTRTASGELSILATKVPECLAPSLHQIPDKVESPETLARQPHVNLLVHPHCIAAMRVRSRILGSMRRFFDDDGFLEVNTPILTAGAGGASARPFETGANQWLDHRITLRISPELFLKRLVIGSGERVYEIGPVFRNEGIDATHNPEFTMCEFYEPYASLDDLIRRTESLFCTLKIAMETLTEEDPVIRNSIAPLEVDLQPPFARLEFVPTIEKAIGRRLPDLTSPTSFEDVAALLRQLDIAYPADATLPCLLDALAALYIEPLCTSPTFVTHQPEVLSPLAKSFVDPRTGQVLARRAELFIHGREYVNAYEEENSPFEQRRKLESQQQQQQQQQKRQWDPLLQTTAANHCGGLDESYIEALEWGLPPTGGWGCGVDRVVMLFTGATRIADVLPFGTLKNVMALGRGRFKRT